MLGGGDLHSEVLALISAIICRAMQSLKAFSRPAEGETFSVGTAPGCNMLGAASQVMLRTRQVAGQSITGWCAVAGWMSKPRGDSRKVGVRSPSACRLTRAAAVSRPMPLQQRHEHECQQADCCAGEVLDSD